MSAGAEDLVKQAAAWLAAAGGGSRRAGSAALSETYRCGGRSAGIDFAAYLTVRLPATHAAVTRVLEEVALRRPGFAPASLLDAGSGPGTASWAATARWSSLDDVTLLDSSRDFLDLAGKLAAAHPLLAAAMFRTGDLTTDVPAADLVVAAYALAEVPADKQARAITALWAAARQMLVLVEPGTPAGFARLRVARDRLLSGGAVPVAPCPHDRGCPMTGEDWCHFAVRLPRSRAHMHAKAARLPFEDEKFAYLAMARAGQPTGGGRIVARPQDSKAGITLKLCSVSGLSLEAVPRRDKESYRNLRRAAWGDLI
jgi:ribosomal protein RSM22 (predicted rRNA methylase)